MQTWKNFKNFNKYKVMGKDNAFIKQEQDAIKKRIQRKLKIQ